MKIKITQRKADGTTNIIDGLNHEAVSKLRDDTKKEALCALTDDELVALAAVMYSAEHVDKHGQIYDQRIIDAVEYPTDVYRGPFNVESQ